MHNPQMLKNDLFAASWNCCVNPTCLAGPPLASELPAANIPGVPGARWGFSILLQGRQATHYIFHIICLIDAFGLKDLGS